MCSRQLDSLDCGVTSTEFLLETRREEMKVSGSKLTIDVLQCCNVIAAGQLEVDGNSTLGPGIDQLGGIVGHVIDHAAVVDASGAAVIRRNER